MKYRNLGKTGLKISEISIGGWLTYGGTVTAEKTAPIINAAIDSGINFIDLADIYTKGKAEEAIGVVLPNYKRSDLVISSKVFWPMSDNVNDRGLSRKHIIESCEKTLKRLNTDYLDIYFCHRYDPETPMEEIVRAMDDLVKAGKIHYWGTSVWWANRIEFAVATAEKFNCHKPSVEQPRYNMLDRHIEIDVMESCYRHGMGLVVWSPLAQGLLTGKYNDGIPNDSRAANSSWLDNVLNDENIKKMKQLDSLAKEIGATLSQLALSWILRRKEISCAIIGATKPEQVVDNAKASDIELSDEMLNRINDILDNEPILPMM